MKKQGVLFLFLLLCHTVIFGTAVPDTAKNVFFNYLSVNNGLSQNSVTCILQDKKGFIWIGTWDGLNRYDGFAVTTRRHESANQNSLSDNRVRCLYEDVNGHIIIGTQSGELNIYDPVHDRFSHLSVNEHPYEHDIKSISNDRQGNLWIGTTDGVTVLGPDYRILKKLLPQQVVNMIICDKTGNMWLATGNGLLFSQGGKDPICIPIKEIGNAVVSAVYEDRHGHIWLGENDQLSRITLEGAEYPYTHIDRQLYHLFPLKEPGEVTGIQEDQYGDLWIAHRMRGLYQLHIDAGGNPSVKKRYATSQPFCNIAENTISTVLIDRSNVLWAGTFQKGVNYANLSIKNFFPFYPLMTDHIGESGYQGKFVTAVCDDGRRIWVGTSTEGLFSYDLQQKKVQSYDAIIGPQWISSIFTAANGEKWIGTSAGLYRIRQNAQPVLQLPGLNIHAIAEDQQHRLWLTTWEGVYIYDIATGKITNLNVKEGLSSKYTFLVYADPVFPVMWVSTIGSGLNRIAYNNAQYQVSTYHQQPGNGLTSNYIWSIYRDSSNIMWLGTDAGLDRVQLNPQGSIARISHITHGMLEDRKILGILKDDKQNLWLSNSQGLFKFNPQRNEVKRYSYKDGLQSNTLTEAVYRNSKGIMYVGGINGLNYFNPDDIQDNPFATQLALTGLQIFNQPVQAGEKINNRVILEKDINNTDKIILSYKENNFLLSFASLHYAVPENNRFKYMLKGYDPGWIIANAGQRFAAYSNMPAGTYEFLITASNNDGRWNEHYKRITFVIKPAPWATWWAKGIYALLLAALVLFIVRHFKTKHALKEQVYREKMEKEKVTELNELKLGFFTNITHELRTPLNLITGPVRELQEKAANYDHFTRFRLELINSNTQRLSTLINQVLDLRKISSQSSSLFVTNGDIVQTVAGVKNAFNWTAEQKHIRYTFDFDHLSFSAWYDKDKIEKVIFNLLANAFKYTPENGEVQVSMTIEGATTMNPVVHITFRDTGTGIDPQEIERIFDMFYQGKKQSSFGSGIGLALSKKLVEMHHGSIAVTSVENAGATFKISFPAGLHSFPPAEIFKTTDKSQLASIPVKKDKHRRSFLIIEDNEEQLAYIREHVSEQFEVYEARDGQTGLEYAIRYQPDVILTDLMMPRLDGIALCRQLKSHAGTRHIPVIIHSVRSNNEALQEALEAGADDFIGKPCDYRLLLLKINNILQSDQQLVANIYKQDIARPGLVEVPDADAALLKQVISIIEKNIADPGFSVEALSREAALSRMHLHRRLHDIIGKTASELIRQIRMQRAAQLLEKGPMRISEVMAEVGISNYHLFNKYFKDTYGLAPKDYRKQE
ncbi:hybrid sensor histidine kinase/response regulator transcription factor [Chitinophaga polysaccharea]|uniref:hybrid sensor histidine kinase/response regulator transcription factor n=1 Tax=Chitinophaga polysaccharea TaxID=1293035 RepID=UPI00163BF270|nr:two-component regulator propeller domain-containing protein [Chitinophaga polysaccharea]